MPDADTAKEIAKDLIEFCKSQWSDFASKQSHHESETIGDDQEVRLPCGADWMGPGLPLHLVLEPTVWLVLALDLSG